jgi:hypothetical protein
MIRGTTNLRRCHWNRDNIAGGAARGDDIVVGQSFAEYFKSQSHIIFQPSATISTYYSNND